MKIILLLIVIINISFYKTAYGEAVEEIIRQANNFLKTSDSMRGNFELEEGYKHSKGFFLFKKPAYFKMVFEDKRTIVFDGKSLWIYFPKINIVIEQDINKDRELSLLIDTIDIGYLTRHYNYSFKKGHDSLQNIKILNEEVYILEFNSKKVDYGFKKLFLYIRDDGFIVRSVAISNSGKIFVLTRKDIILNSKIDSSLFRRKIPKDAKVIKNPFTTGRY